MVADGCEDVLVDVISLSKDGLWLLLVFGSTMGRRWMVQLNKPRQASRMSLLGAG